MAVACKTKPVPGTQAQSVNPTMNEMVLEAIRRNKDPNGMNRSEY